MFISQVSSTMKSVNMNVKQVAIAMSLSSAMFAGAAILPTAEASAQCQDGSASTVIRVSSSTPETKNTSPTAVTTDGAPDYVLQAETALAPRTFEHESFSLKSIVKSAVSVYPTNAKNEISPYENLWFHDGKPIGLERRTELKIPADKNVGIKVVQSPCASFDESKAAGNTIMRLVLDILKNHDKVTIVSVPSASYTNILMELQRRKMSVMPPGEKAPETAKLKFKLESESTGMKQEVYFM